MNTFLDVVIVFGIILLSLCMLGMLYRIIIGPSLHDRIVALDAIGVLLMALTALVSMLLDTPYLLVVILLLGILAFIATIAFAKYLEKGVVIENDRDAND